MTKVWGLDVMSALDLLNLSVDV